MTVKSTSIYLGWVAGWALICAAIWEGLHRFLLVPQGGADPLTIISNWRVGIVYVAMGVIVGSLLWALSTNPAYAIRRGQQRDLMIAVPTDDKDVPFAVIEAMETAITQHEARGPQWQAKYAYTAMVEAYRMLERGEDPRDMPMLK